MKRYLHIICPPLMLHVMEKHSFLVAFSVLTILINCYECSAFADANPRLTVDEESLVAFRSRITSDPFDILARNWSSTNRASFCSWAGVSCGANQRIRALDLHGLKLQGTIAPHLGNLTFLTSLDLSFNNFTGRIPEELSGLRGLKVLNLGANNLTGVVPLFLGTFKELEQIKLFGNSFIGAIPALSNLSKLEILDLSYNLLRGTLPGEIGSISSLQIINLMNNSFSGPIPMNLCDNTSKLNILELSSNSLSGAIPSNIYKCKSLEILSLSFNEFNGSIPKEIGELSMLNELRLRRNNHEGEIPSVIFNLSSLIVLDLSFNNLSGSLPLDIQLPNLEWLGLQSNHLKGQIFPNILNCRKIWTLILRGNEFTGDIPKQVGNLTQLSILDLTDNNIMGELPWELGNLTLKGLSLHGNGFSGSIPFPIFNISTLIRLELSENHLRGQLPIDMGISLPNLQVLCLTSNYLTGTIPNTLNNASKLAIISMSNNSFTGMVPNFNNLKLLEQLFVGGNSLNGDLLFISSLANCTHLESLELSSNKFNGVLPTSLGSLSKSLLYFNAFDCHIKGSIPPTVGNLTGLIFFGLERNELTGLIPEAIGGLTRIERLYLSHNRLQGNIPTELCRLSRLGELYLRDNMLNGTIPACLGDLKSLLRLFLDSNRLTSVVPNLWNIPNLLELNLSTNFLSGNISSVIPTLKSLSHLDLSWNQFSDEIPSYIGELQSLENLSLAHNDLRGSIPQSIGNLRGLVSLDLSHNTISGYIPKSLESLMFLSHLDLSYNRLEGEIPSGGRFSNFTAQPFTMNYALCGDVQMQVPPCHVEGDDNSSSNHVSSIIYILAPTMLAILAVILAIWQVRRRIAHKRCEVSSILSWRRISYQELKRATEDFSEANIIGRGSFGSVYKGTLSDGLNIVVKVFDLQLEGAIKSFDVECEVMSTIRHRNLVSIISCCSNMDFKALVLEYMPNGSLEKWLHSYSPQNSLSVLQRLNIAIDTALALEYLHHGNPLPIVHCDLKPSNILIDGDMTGHVGDFGITKLFGEGEAVHHTITLATVGYMAPEYGSEGKISTSCDTYSYGITLLELFTSKKPTEDMFTGEMSLKDWVHKALQEKTVSQVVGAGLLDPEDQHFSAKERCVSSTLDLAMKCLVISPHERINMIEIVVTLEKIRASLLRTG